MKALRAALLLFGTAIIFSSCGPTLTPFTQNLYEKGRWTDAELRQIQFYLSDDIVMRRELSGSLSEIRSGDIKMIDGRKIEEIVIRRGTPGVFLFSPKSDRFAVSFEEGDDQRYLIFGPSPKAGDRYVQLAAEWRRRDGTVTYDGRKYRVDVASAFAGLMVDLRRARRVDLASRTASGRSIN